MRNRRGQWRLLEIPASGQSVERAVEKWRKKQNRMLFGSRLANQFSIFRRSNRAAATKYLNVTFSIDSAV